MRHPTPIGCHPALLLANFPTSFCCSIIKQIIDSISSISGTYIAPTFSPQGAKGCQKMTDRRREEFRKRCSRRCLVDRKQQRVRGRETWTVYSVPLAANMVLSACVAFMCVSIRVSNMCLFILCICSICIHRSNLYNI